MSYNMSSAIVIGKISAWIGRIFKLKGTALPGLLALKLNPQLINQISTYNNLKSILVTGTNGKTTITKLLGDIFKLQQIKFIHNHSGSNLLRGIASTLINQSNVFGKLKTNLAIWEVDEAAVTVAIQQLKPTIILFNNLSRDQLDRYGEIDSILKSWQTAVNYLPDSSTVIINRTDINLIKLTFSNLIYFGRRLSPGQYHLANIDAVKALTEVLNLKPKYTQQAIQEFKPAFGRGEALMLNKKPVQIFLVKNPVGMQAVWEMLNQKQQLNKTLLLILNDLIADGTDVSWIYDVNFNYLKSRKNPIIVSGTRALDMALRLKIGGLNPKLLIVEPNLRRALAYSPDYILPTYTAMLALRKIIFKQKFD